MPARWGDPPEPGATLRTGQPSRSATGNPAVRCRRPLSDEAMGVILIHGVEPVVRTVEAGCRSQPRDRVNQAVVREGTLPPQVPSGPDPPATRTRSGPGHHGGGIPRASARLPHGACGPAAD